MTNRRRCSSHPSGLGSGIFRRRQSVRLSDSDSLSETTLSGIISPSPTVQFKVVKLKNNDVTIPACSDQGRGMLGHGLPIFHFQIPFPPVWKHKQILVPSARRVEPRRMAESQRIRRKKTLIQISKKSTHAQLWRFGGSSLPVVGAPPPFGSRVSLSTGIVKHALKLYSTTSVVRFFFLLRCTTNLFAFYPGSRHRGGT